MKFNFDNTYLTLPGELFTVCPPTTVSQPQLVAFNDSLATELGLSTDNQTPDELAAIFSGNVLPEGTHQYPDFSDHIIPAPDALI